MSEHRSFNAVTQHSSSLAQVTSTGTHKASDHDLETGKVLEMEWQGSLNVNEIPNIRLSDIISRENPTVEWDCVTGLEDAKARLRETIVLPFKFPQLFTNMRRTSARALLYGPSGTGKSYLIKAVAFESKCNLWSVRMGALTGLENPILIFKNLIRAACDSKPSIICIDELECISSSSGNDSGLEDLQQKKRELRTELLVHLDSILKHDSGVQIVGVTNAPWELDRRLQKRFGKLLYFPLPGHADRQKTFQVHVEGSTSHGGISNLSAEDYCTLADKTEGFSASEISRVVQHALNGVDMSKSHIEADESTCPALTISGVLKSLESVHPMIAQSEIEKFDQWTKYWSG